MIRKTQNPTVGLLLSGGLDSAILLGHLLDSGYQVQPFYIRSNVIWQYAELAATRNFLDRIAQCSWPTGGDVCPLVELNLPLDDLYGEHWSINGQRTPDARTSDEAVFLPARNALLVIKAAVWCGLNQIDQLALAPLAANPFPDADNAFFTAYETALGHAASSNDMFAAVQLWRPFARLDKSSVMRLGRHLPLELTFSCIRPRDRLHCGSCNKCGERQKAFAAVGMADPTPYAHAAG
ncbi:MAG: 7-cyano-7-deazaguanine synthase [Planctomycetales bacterium]|nr:7-cyano-7-deazaguanine synthase [Planctomycetales bacterium]